MQLIRRFPVLLPLAPLALPIALVAQVVNPADKQQPPPSGQGQPLVVEGRRVSDLREEDRVGSYGQPEWTTHRRFTETRLYVIPEGSVEFEYWLIPEIPPGGGTTQTETQYEFEFGLPWRCQLDLYTVAHQDGNQGPMQFDQQKVEIRHALADWDEIWGNPTLYFEWAANSNVPDHVETKLLFGGEIESSWHWGANLVYEHETGAAQENSYEVTGGVSKTLVDQRWSVGAEFKLAFVNSKTDPSAPSLHRSNTSDELLIGPTVQFRPLPRVHIDVAPLVGVTTDAPDFKLTVVFGYEF